MDPRFAAIPTVLVGTGLRPEELFALERRDLDLDAGTLAVQRVYSQGVVKDCRKSSRQRRRVPLRQRVVQALKAQPPRLDTPLVFPAARGGHIDIEKFRYREWAPALRAADVAHRRIYDCRHTFASWAIAGGVQLFYLARIMGTSVQMIDQTYGHLLPDSEGTCEASSMTTIPLPQQQEVNGEGQPRDARGSARSQRRCCSHSSIVWRHRSNLSQHHPNLWRHHLRLGCVSAESWRRL